MSNVFDRDTTVTKEGQGRYSATIGDAWQIVHGPNGGYLAAVILNALINEIDDANRTPRSLTVHYLKPPQEGPVTIDVTIERAGRSLTSMSARMHQGDRGIAIALAAFSVPFDGPEFVETTMPKVPMPEELEDVDSSAFPRHLHNFDYRHALGDFFSGGDRAESGAWIRLHEPRLIDHLLLAAMADTLPPAVFSRLHAPNPAPTVDFTVHFRSSIPPDASPEDFFLCVLRSKLSREGFFEEDGRIFSRSGVLLAQSRQLAILRNLG